MRPGDEVDFRVERVSVDQGAGWLDVAARRVGSKDDVGLRTGHPRRSTHSPAGASNTGHGHGGVRAPGKATRKVWDTADRIHPRTLGFSVLRDPRQPTSIIASGVLFTTTDRVLPLTPVHPGRDERWRRAGRQMREQGAKSRSLS